MSTKHFEAEGAAASPAVEEILTLLSERVLTSERLRALALMSVTGLAAVIVGVLILRPELVTQANNGHYTSALKTMGVIFVLMAGLEGLVWKYLGLRLNSKRSLPEAFCFLIATIEVLFVTLIIWDWSRVAGPLQSVGGMLPYLYFPFIAASALHLNRGLCWFVGFISAIAFLSVAELIVTGSQDGGLPLLVSTTSFCLKGWMMLVCGAVASFVADQMKSYLTTAVGMTRERDRTIAIFGQHVSPQVAKRLIDQPTGLKAEQRYVCVLFLDIRGFSSIAAEYSPTEVMNYLNQVFGPMIEIVNTHGGIVNKFLGDGFMALFGAPFADAELQRNAVYCALALLDCVTKANADQSIPPTRIGIGIHSGAVMAGTLGNRQRGEYTVLGDTVNAAARIEQEAKRLGAQIIVSMDALNGLEEVKSGAIDLGEVTLRGISTPLRLYQLA